MAEKSKSKVIWITIGVILVVMLFFGVGSYNSLVGLSENVKTQQSNIETQLQRRADLIPNLVNTVKGISNHESEIINTISEARAKLSSSTSSLKEKAQADSELTSALSRLLVVVENYPEIKSNEQFNSLMDTLSGTENRIAVSRKDYNDAAKVYNQKIRSFPTVIMANIFGFQQVDYFEASESSKEVPTVDFS